MKVQIPEPCHEDWNKMNPKEKGRFCGSCEKIVVDFSQMTDIEIVGYFKEYKSEKTCGHFKKSQIDRKLKQPIAQTPIRKFFLRELLAACFTFFLASQSKAQQTGDTIFVQPINSNGISFDKINSEIAINGKVINGTENLANATISIKGTNHKTVSLENGIFSITIPSEIAQNQETVILVAEYEGLETTEIEVKTSPTNQFFEIDFAEKETIPNEEIINALAGRAGGVQIVEDIITITGNISSADGELPGATVQIKGTNQGTTTDLEGNYSLVVPQESILVFRFVGYETKEITLKTNQSVIDVQLNDDQLIDGALVIHYKWYNPRHLWYRVKNIFR